MCPVYVYVSLDTFDIGLLFFFFSRRRREYEFGNWDGGSEVCSSELVGVGVGGCGGGGGGRGEKQGLRQGLRAGWQGVPSNSECPFNIWDGTSL